MKDQSFIRELKAYQKRIIDWMAFKETKQGTQFNKEQNTVIKFVVPLLEILGWECSAHNVEFEYFVPKKGRADIALYINDPEVPKILVEVKPIQDSIKNAATQMFSKYLVNSKVNFGITTNGRLLMLFDKFRVNRQYQHARLLLTLKSEDLVKYEDVLSVFSRNKVKNGILDKLVNAYHKKEYWEWRKFQKKEYDEYQLPLIYARRFLKRN